MYLKNTSQLDKYRTNFFALAGGGSFRIFQFDQKLEYQIRASLDKTGENLKKPENTESNN